METLNQINFPKLEHEQFEDFDFMFLDEHRQRSLQMPLLPPIDMDFWTSNLSNNSLIDFPRPLLPQQNFINNEMITQSLENNVVEDDLWSECPPLFEDAWEPISQIYLNNTIPCTFDSNPNPNPNPNPIPIGQNPIPIVQNPIPIDNNDPFFLLNNINIEDYFNEQALSMVNVEEQNRVHCDTYKTREVTNNTKVPKTETIQYEEIRKYFDVPITRAAKELNVGLTVLKKRCRELNIKRWPHRKLKSLNSLISNVKEMGMTEVVQFLEEHKRKLHCVPGLELSEETKKLRQAFFKINYKRRRANTLDRVNS